MSAGGVIAVAAIPAVAMALDPAVLQLVALVITVIIGPLVAWWIKRDVDKIARSQIHVEEKIGELEKNTNSIKDELVRTTKLMSHQEGMVAGKAVADAEQALIAKGELAGRAAMSEPERAIAQPAAQAAPPAPAAPVAPPVIVVENVTAENVDAKTVRAGTLMTGEVKEKK